MPLAAIPPILEVFIPSRQLEILAKRNPHQATDLWGFFFLPALMFCLFRRGLVVVAPRSTGTCFQIAKDTLRVVRGE